jgi:hypothetical protein
MTGFRLDGLASGGAYTFKYKQSSLSPAGGGGVLKYASVFAAVAPVPNACRHAGDSFWATRGCFHGLGAVGGANRNGGLLANGMPR